MTLDVKQEAKIEIMKQLMGTLGTMQDSKSGEVLGRELALELVKVSSGPHEGSETICEATVMSILEALELKHEDVDVDLYLEIIQIVMDAMKVMLIMFQLGGNIVIPEEPVKPMGTPFIERS